MSENNERKEQHMNKTPKSHHVRHVLCNPAAKAMTSEAVAATVALADIFQCFIEKGKSVIKLIWPAKRIAANSELRICDCILQECINALIWLGTAKSKNNLFRIRILKGRGSKTGGSVGLEVD